MTTDKTQFLCPLCQQALTHDENARISARDDNEMGLFRVAFVVELMNQNIALSIDKAELQFSIFDHDDG